MWSSATLSLELEVKQATHVCLCCHVVVGVFPCDHSSQEASNFTNDNAILQFTPPLFVILSLTELILWMLVPVGKYSQN